MAYILFLLQHAGTGLRRERELERVISLLDRERERERENSHGIFQKYK
jgi:hypothetical protein